MSTAMPLLCEISTNENDNDYQFINVAKYAIHVKSHKVPSNENLDTFSNSDELCQNVHILDDVNLAEDLSSENTPVHSI